MKEIKLVVDNGKVYTIQSEELVEIVIKKYDVALDLDYLKIVITGNRPEISDVLLVDTILYGKEHTIKEVFIGEEHFKNEGNGYLCGCTVDDSGNLVIEILNKDSYICEMNCKSNIEQLELVLKEHIELVALIESVVKKLVFIDKGIDFKKVIALCSIYDFLTSIGSISIMGYSYYVKGMYIHKYYNETEKGISNERIEEILNKKCLFKYGFKVTNNVIKNAINMIIEHFTSYSLENMMNIINTYENLFVLSEKLGWDEEDEEEAVQKTEEQGKVDGERKSLIIEGVEDLLGNPVELHYSGSVDGYDCFE